MTLNKITFEVKPRGVGDMSKGTPPEINNK